MKRSTLVIVLLLVAIGRGQDNQLPKVEKESFHLYLLAGQSNMAGRGIVSEQDKQPHPRVSVLNRLNRWAPAVDPLHFDKSWAGVGPGLTFGKAMAEADPNVTIGLIPCAVGGSPISTWKPHVYYPPVKVYPYDDAIARCRIAMKHGVLKGILWHQGEGDCKSTEAPLYAERLPKVIAQFRHDLETPDLFLVAGTFVDAYTARVAESEIVIDAIKTVAENDDKVFWISGAGLPSKDDKVHFNAEGARQLGRRYAEAVIKRQNVEQPAP